MSSWKKNKAQCPFLLPGDAKGRTCWLPCRDPLMRSPEHLQELLDMNLSPKIIPKVVLPHLQVKIYLMYFLVLDIPFSSEDV